jgi:hypothetical protein
LEKIPKRRKIYQITIKCTKWPQNDQKIDQMEIKYTKWLENRPNGNRIYQHLPLQYLPKLTQIGIFDSKICHLATLLRRRQNSWVFCVTKFFESEKRKTRAWENSVQGYFKDWNLTFNVISNRVLARVARWVWKNRPKRSPINFFAKITA